MFLKEPFDIASKVRLYLIRREEVLVFSEPDFPEARHQVPGGTVDPGEELIDTVVRELYEESGLKIEKGWQLVSTKEIIYLTNMDPQFESTFFNMNPNISVENWSHIVSGEGVDNGIEFSYEWMSFQKAKKLLWPWMVNQLEEVELALNHK